MREGKEGNGVVHGLKRMSGGADDGNYIIVERSKQL
jgi:hypothetical protein